MQKVKSNKILAITLIAVFFATILISMQTVNAAATEWTTYCYVMAAPDPVQVGHYTTVGFRIDKTNPLATMRDNHFKGLTVEITKPDGTTEMMGPYEADATSGSWFNYIPTQVGTYQFQSFFAGQWANSTTYQRWYKPSQSSVLNVTVQEEPIPNFPDNPLPTSYWERPIYGENKGWSAISNNWLMQAYDRTSWSTHSQAVFAPYAIGPNSSHILWTHPIDFGGIVGGDHGDDVFRTGLSYEQYYSPIIISGRIIYTEHGPATSTDIFGTRCIDLYTGEDIWYLPGVNIAFAETLDFNSGNEHGLVTMLWETNTTAWTCYDAFRGVKLFTIANMTGLTGTTTFNQNGEVISYILGGNATNRWLAMWNSTKAVIGTTADYWSPPVGAIYNGPSGIEWNVTIPTVSGAQSITLFGEGYILATFIDSSVYPIVYQEMAYDITSIKKDSSGTYPTSLNYLWLTNRTNLYLSDSNAIMTATTINSGVYARYDQGNMILRGFSIKTGQMLWQTEPIAGGWATFERSWTIAYGTVYGAGLDGHIRAWNASTGKLIWDYYEGSTGYEQIYGTTPIYNGFTVADGKLYVANDDHSPDAVMWRGGKTVCIDAYTGQDIWNISGWLRHAVLSDGYLTSNNVLDMSVYTIGKGPSKTTISAPQTAVLLGTTLMLTGTVTDQSSAQEGTACISEKSMSAWMEYLHMQKPKPTDATGVIVHLTTIDPNGNLQDIGTTTSDSDGNYAIAWNPPVPGTYKAVATFEGSTSYGQSDATTYFTVNAPTATLSPQPATVQSIADQYFLPAIAGLFIAVIISIGLTLLVLLKKKA